MPRGGPRPGAGRPKGKRNKRTEEQAQEMEQSGQTPLEFLTSVFRDPEQDIEKRLDAAKAAAPYVHPKQPTAVDLTGELEVVPPFVPKRGD
jgi:hypothetical protein